MEAITTTRCLGTTCGLLSNRHRSARRQGINISDADLAGKRMQPWEVVKPGFRNRTACTPIPPLVRRIQFGIGAQIKRPLGDLRHAIEAFQFTVLPAESTMMPQRLEDLSTSSSEIDEFALWRRTIGRAGGT